MSLVTLGLGSSGEQNKFLFKTTKRKIPFGYKNTKNKFKTKIPKVKFITKRMYEDAN